MFIFVTTKMTISWQIHSSMAYVMLFHLSVRPNQWLFQRQCKPKISWFINCLKCRFKWFGGNLEYVIPNTCLSSLLQNPYFHQFTVYIQFKFPSTFYSHQSHHHNSSTDGGSDSTPIDFFQYLNSQNIVSFRWKIWNHN